MGSLEIKNCHACGGGADLIKKPEEVLIRCSACGRETRFIETSIEDALTIWNSIQKNGGTE